MFFPYLIFWRKRQYNILPIFLSWRRTLIYLYIIYKYIFGWVNLFVNWYIFFQWNTFTLFFYKWMMNSQILWRWTGSRFSTGNILLLSLKCKIFRISSNLFTHLLIFATIQHVNSIIFYYVYNLHNYI